MRATPFLRLCIPLAFGICLQIWLVISWWWLTGILLLMLAGLLAWSFLPLGKQYTTNPLRGVLLYVLIICAGALLVLLKDIRSQPRYFGKFLQGRDTLLVSIQEPLQERARSWKTTAVVQAIIHHRQVIPVKGNLLLYFQKHNTVSSLQCGDEVWISSTLNAVSNSGNPGAFNYRQYCATKQIFHQAYLKAGSWKRSAYNSNTLADRYLLQARAWCIHTLQKYLGSGPEAALAAALLIGYRYDLDRDMVQAYTNAGVVHIIAISGMHLALIYASLLWVLQWWPPHRLSNLAKALIVISMLWGFALITGAAASILRAAVMFTAVAIGQFVLDRHTNTYNTLAASAFLLLCYDPWLLWDAGFQLSYLAVLSIVLCYKPLYELWLIQNKWLNKLWEAVALTLAAQLFTIPVCLYYFHQFPNLFLPANLLIVTLSTIILYGLIVLLVVSPWPALAHYTGMGIKYLITAMNCLVLFIEQLPYAVTSNIYLPLYATVCAYVIIAALTAVWLGKQPKAWLLALYAGLCWVGVDVTLTIQAAKRRTIIIYNVPAYTAIDVISGHQLQFAGDTAIQQNDSLRSRYLQPARLLYGAAPGVISAFSRKSTFISMGHTRMVVVDSTWRPFNPAKKFSTDYILLSHHPCLTISQLKNMFTCKMIIFDASNPLWQIQRWKNDCSTLTLRCFSVPEQGAYLINF